MTLADGVIVMRRGVILHDLVQTPLSKSGVQRLPVNFQRFLRVLHGGRGLQLRMLCERGAGRVVTFLDLRML